MVKTRRFSALPVKEQNRLNKNQRDRNRRLAVKADPKKQEHERSLATRRQQALRLRRRLLPNAQQAGEGAEVAAEIVAQENDPEKGGKLSVVGDTLAREIKRPSERRAARRKLPGPGDAEVINLGGGDAPSLTLGDVKLVGGHTDIEDRLGGRQGGASSESGRLQFGVSSIPPELIKYLRVFSLYPVQEASSVIRTREEDDKPTKGLVPRAGRRQDLHRDLPAVHPKWGPRQLKAWNEHIFLAFIPLKPEGGGGGTYKLLIGPNQDGQQASLIEVPFGSALVLRTDTYHAGPYSPGEDPDRLYVPCIGRGRSKDRLPTAKIKELILSHSPKYNKGSNLALALGSEMPRQKEGSN